MKATGSRVYFYPWVGETKLNKTISMKLKTTPYLKIKLFQVIWTGTQVQVDSIACSYSYVPEVRSPPKSLKRVPCTMK